MAYILPASSSLACRRSRATVPTGPQWVLRDQARRVPVHLLCAIASGCALFSRGGHDCATADPAITEALQALPVRSVTIDGEGVICGPNGRSDFDRLRAVRADGLPRNVPVRVRPTRTGWPRPAPESHGQTAAPS